MTRSAAELASEYDLVVIGAGAAGMTAALVGALRGLRVVMIEKSAQVGGTSARAAGTLWIPGNHFMTAADATADIEQARTYLNTLIGENSPSNLRDAFLSQGPAMLEYLLTHTQIRFKPCPRHADYHPDASGATPGGRPVEAQLFDGRILASDFDLLRSPIAEFMVFGGMMVSKADIDLLLRAGRNWAGSRHAASLGLRYLRDRLSHRRGTRLSMGNALCASLLNECINNSVGLAMNTVVDSIERIGDSSHRLLIDNAGIRKTLHATRGIVFAGGGFSGSVVARKTHLPDPTPAVTAAFEGADGSSISLAQASGAQLGPSREHNAWWFPSSVVPRADGSTGVFPHIIMDRAKPGLIAVNRAGERFTNEGVSYHQFARAQYEKNAIPCWLIADAKFIRRYGLGAVRPGGVGLRRALTSGYLKSANTLEGLAQRIGIDATGLRDSARRMSQFAASGADSDFGKGTDSLSRQNGDASHSGPNPCLGTVTKPPFYAVEVAPADLGTCRGLLTDDQARLLDKNDEPIAGLYACGNDMQSMMGGQYPAPGVTLGPAMTFAFLAASHCATSK